MEYNLHNELITSALDVVRVYDPGLHQAMTQANWSVSTDMMDAFSEMPFEFFIETYEEAMGAFGMTVSDRFTLPPPVKVARPRTFLNPYSTQLFAGEYGIPGEVLASTTLAHEFAHIHQRDGSSLALEPPAFRAGIRFARKLPERFARVIVPLNLDALEHLTDIPVYAARV
jgi:hypothetical protein